MGAGSAGCVVAARLSEDPSRTVLVLEAGPAAFDDTRVLDPTRMPVGPGSDLAIDYPVELMSDTRGSVSRGRVVGGSGAVNGAYFVRAPDADFARWPASWSADEVLPWFRFLEHDRDFTGPRHGADGPVPVERRDAERFDGVGAAFADVALAAGFGWIADLNDGGDAGVGPVPLNVASGRRASTAHTHLRPALGRTGLTLRPRALVHRIAFEGNKVRGVVWSEGAGERLVLTNRVVLAAGAVETPALLQRSGVGPVNVLVRQGIPVVADSPNVGRDFTDHPEMLVPFMFPDGRDATDVSAPVVEVVLNVGDCEIRPYTAPFGDLVPGSGVSEWQLGVGLMRADSVGAVEIVSADPSARPSVRYGYLRSGRDRDALGEGMTVAREILSTKQFGGGRPGGGHVASPAARLSTAAHLCGSCRMGTDADSVVDERGRVRGVDGVFVADSSVIPVVPTRGPHATVVMVAERIAAFLAAPAGADTVHL
ncbi:choline dehydrogenase [Rhodococcus triatomae]|uniref:Choline dehydrogenase n=1 Tax=Rhodococcus triatomae TaxID=300028 RepID=A0A1G8JKR0_9NOCA|nr:choline dehydrogenase [Rhodococcus triatomae]